MLGRIAGDEFICLLKGYSRSQVIELGEYAQDQIGFLHLEVRPDQYAHVGVSFGVAEFSIDGQSIDELLNAASSACRQNKDLLNARRIQPQTLPYSYARKGTTGPIALVK